MIFYSINLHVSSNCSLPRYDYSRAYRNIQVLWQWYGWMVANEKAKQYNDWWHLVGILQNLTIIKNGHASDEFTAQTLQHLKTSCKNAEIEQELIEISKSRWKQYAAKENLLSSSFVTDSLLLVVFFLKQRTFVMTRIMDYYFMPFLYR